MPFTPYFNFSLCLKEAPSLAEERRIWEPISTSLHEGISLETLAVHQDLRERDSE